MEVDVVFEGFDQADWFSLLKSALAAMESDPALVVNQLLPPPGTFGAGGVAAVKATFASVVGLATVVGAGASVYGTVSTPPVACEVSAQTGQSKTTMTYDCKAGNPTQMAEILSKLVAKVSPLTSNNTVSLKKSRYDPFAEQFRGNPNCVWKHLLKNAGF